MFSWYKFSKTYLPWAITIGVGAILFYPLVLHSTYFFPFVVPKNLLFRYTVQILVVLYAWLALTNSEYRPRWNRFIQAMLAYFGIMLLTSLPGLSVDWWSSWWGDFERMGGMISQLHVLAYFLILTQVMRKQKQWLVLFTCSLFFAVIMGFIGLLQYLNINILLTSAGGARISGSVGNATYYAAYCLLNIYIAAWFLCQSHKEIIFSFLAKVWLYLLIGFDAFLVIWELFKVGTGNPGIYAKALQEPAVLGFLFIVHALVIGWYVWRQHVQAGYALLTVITVFYSFLLWQTQTRGAIIGLGGSVLVMAILYVWRHWSQRQALTGVAKKFYMGSLVMIIVAVLVPVLLVSLKNTDFVQSSSTLNRLASISSTDVTSQSRLLTWEASWKAMLDRPWGWGLENYKTAYNKYFPNLIFRDLGSQIWFDRAHNMVFDIGVASGFAGLIAYGFMIFVALRFLLTQWQRGHDRDFANSLLLIAFLLAYIFQNLFVFDTMNSDVIVYLLLAYIADQMFKAKAQTSDEAVVSEATVTSTLALPMAKQLTVVGVALAVFAVSWVTTITPAKANRLLFDGIMSTRALDSRTGQAGLVYNPAAFDRFQAAIDYNVTGRYEARQQLATYALDLARNPQVTPDQKKLALRAGFRALEENVELEPSNMRHHLFLATFTNASTQYYQQVDQDAALSQVQRNITSLTEAERLSPTRPQIFFEKAQTYLFLGQMDAALASARRGVELSPYVRESHVDLVIFYLLADQIDGAMEVWEEAKALKDIEGNAIPPIVSDYQRVLSIATSKNAVGFSIQLYQELLGRDGNNPSYWFSLATIYGQVGKKAEALDAAKRAAALSTAPNPQIDAFIKDLESTK